ncbi:MAG: hypothetical protein HQL11_02745, partial [Candidatus Omnitrophica bacterium]|nr:hypothetical protein [Candidatus Omnitrophota bacterium]
LICRRCQKVISYAKFLSQEIRLLKELEKMVGAEHDFVIEDHQIAFTGICKQCA